MTAEEVDQISNPPGGIYEIYRPSAVVFIVLAKSALRFHTDNRIPAWIELRAVIEDDASTDSLS